jgi:predicted permease
MLHVLIARVRSLLGGRSADRDLDAELADHLDHQIRWRIEQGMTREDAVRRARLDLGGLEPLKERCRDERGTRWLEDAWRDVVYATRRLRRTPAFAAAAIGSLALGIGANTVVFSLLNGLVLRPPPIHDPDRVLFVGGTRFAAQSYPNYLDFRDRNVTFANLAGFRLAPMGLRHDAATDQAWGYLVTGNYFETLGVQPWLGRLLAPADDTAPGANPVLVLGFAYWRSHFAGDPAVVGRTVAINTRAYTIVGVAPRDFGGTERFFQPDVWVPISMQPQIEQFAWTTSRGASNLDVIGRLADGATPAQAEANLNAIAADLARRYPDDDAGLAVRVSRPGWLGDQLGAPVTAFARALMALVLLVLFAACANLAGLVSARAADRRRELAVRVAIGAGRGRILRQLTVEALVLATAGGIVGAGVATALLGALSRWRAVAEIPIHFDVAVDAHVLLFAALATLASGLLVGVAPARIAWRTDLASAWKGTSATPAVRWRRWTTRDLLVAVQVAISCALVFAATVAGRELVRELSAPVGFQPDNADVVALDLGLAGYNEDRGRAFH